MSKAPAHSSRGGVVALGTCLLGAILLPGPAGRPARADEPGPAKRRGHIYIASVGVDALRGIVAIDPNDGTRRIVTDDISQHPSISPDGTRLVIQRFLRDKPDPGLWVYDTARERDGFRVSERRGNAVWSPDGKELLLGSRGPGGVEYWRMPADGSREERVPIPSTEMVVDWSPDGRWILTASMRRRPLLPWYVMHPDGTGEKVLLAQSNPLPEIGGSVGLGGRFSRDGRTVLFSRTVLNSQMVVDGDGRPRVMKSAELLLVDVDGGPPRRLLSRVGGDFPTSACWSPDGKEIAVLVVDRVPARPGDDHETRIEIVDLAGALLKTIALPGPASARNLIDWR